MNNVVVFLVDSVFSECIGNQKTKISSTPFLDKLAREGIFIPNMFSFGPYTNAATKGLFCSEPTLDDYGYFFGINTAEYNHYRAFQENGYETYGFYYPYYLISNKTKRYIDHTVYTSGFIYSAIWNGNYKIYAEFKKKRDLTDHEWELLCKFTEMLIDLWIEYYRDCIENDEAFDLLKGFCVREDLQKSKIRLEAEYKKFNQSKRGYVSNILDEGMKHELAFIESVDVKKIPKLDFIRDYVYKHNSDTIKYIEKRTIELNKKNNPIDFTASLKAFFAFIKSRDKNNLRLIYNQNTRLHTQKKMIKDTFAGVWQEHPSAKTQIDCGLEMIAKRDNKETPFYLFFHFLEVHERLAYYSYDIEDKKIIDTEFMKAKNLAQNCGENFRGSLVYQMALQYVDSCIESFYTRMDQMGLLDQTTIMVIADHGSSYSYFPIRHNVTNNFYKENYHIPMLIWSKRVKDPHVFKGFYTSMDAFPTLMEVCELKIPSSFKGSSAYSIPEGREYVITEYMGPGAPDMLTKAAWISIRNRHYVIAFKCPMDRNFSVETMVEVYDIVKDPYQKQNLYKSVNVNDDEIKYLIRQVKNRFEMICVNRDAFIERLINVEV